MRIVRSIQVVGVVASTHLYGIIQVGKADGLADFEQEVIVLSQLDGYPLVSIVTFSLRAASMTSASIFSWTIRFETKSLSHHILQLRDDFSIRWRHNAARHLFDARKLSELEPVRATAQAVD